jgi:hypothetical protein
LNRGKTEQRVTFNPSLEPSADTSVNLITEGQMKSAAGILSVTVPAMSAAFISAV